MSAHLKVLTCNLRKLRDRPPVRRKRNDSGTLALGVGEGGGADTFEIQVLWCYGVMILDSHEVAGSKVVAATTKPGEKREALRRDLGGLRWGHWTITP